MVGLHFLSGDLLVGGKGFACCAGYLNERCRLRSQCGIDAVIGLANAGFLEDPCFGRAGHSAAGLDGFERLVNDRAASGAVLSASLVNLSAQGSRFDLELGLIGCDCGFGLGKTEIRQRLFNNGKPIGLCGVGNDGKAQGIAACLRGLIAKHG